ncbi:MAG: hypothetical protein ACPGXX_10480 [Planctomycetaceae bacterium]
MLTTNFVGMPANNPLLLQRADAPGIELVASLLPIVVARCHSQVAIIGTAIPRMQV